MRKGQSVERRGPHILYMRSDFPPTWPPFPVQGAAKQGPNSQQMPLNQPVTVAQWAQNRHKRCLETYLPPCIPIG